MAREHRRGPVLITDAQVSPEQESRRRQIRYLLMMALRVACLVGAAVIASKRPPHWGVWTLLCLAGMVLLPWLAVMGANDRLAKTRAQRRADAARVPQARQQSISAPNKVIDEEQTSGALD